MWHEGASIQLLRLTVVESLIEIRTYMEPQIVVFYMANAMQ